MTASSPPAAALAGKLHRRGDIGYEAARVGRVFNGRRPERYPAAVLLAESADDVVAGVRLARREGWQVAVRAGGHSWAAWSIRDEALLIDLGALREISYDEQTGVVSAAPAVQGGAELDPYLAERGRFFNGGHCPTVGIGGFLLQGGQGWCARGWGWASERVVAVDVVTADGELVRADAEQNSDLYWAARGSGPGFFGVVTRFHLRTMPRPAAFAHTVHLYPLEVFDEVMAWLYEMHASVSPDVEIVTVSLTPSDPIPGHDGGRVLAVTGLAMCSSQAEAQEALRPFETCPVLDRALVRADAVPTTLAEQRLLQAEANPEGHRYLVDNAWLDGTPEAVVPAIRTAFLDLPTPEAFTIWFSMAPLRELPDMAMSLQSEAYLATYLVYRDEADDDEHRRWLADSMHRMEPVTLGQYLGDSDHTRRQVRFMTDDAWARYQRIRAERDPDGLFCGYLTSDPHTLNQNHWM